MPPAPDAWSLLRRIAFRFGLSAALLMTVPFPLGLIPGTGAIAAAFGTAQLVLVRWFARAIGVEVPPFRATGSGDQTWHYVHLLLVAIIACVICAVWSLLARRRAHPRLAASATVYIRYYLATVMLGYGLAKVFPMQFPPLPVSRYDHAIGEMSPMGLLWTFMSHSQAYTLFAGMAECAGALLLVWRRTYVVGALVIAAVMTNVVLLNFCYDVPVKLFSLQLLAMAIALLSPHLRRLVCAALGRSTPELPPRIRGTLQGERARLALKCLLLASIALRGFGYYSMTRDRVPPPSPLAGIWRVDHLVIDGVERPPLLTDDSRWRKLIVSGSMLVIRMATDRREYYRAEVDAEAQTLTILRGIHRDTFHYATAADDRVVLDGARVHAEILREPTPLLMSRGFHWIQEEPFNR